MTTHPGRAHIEALRALPAPQQRSALEHLVDLVPFDVLWHAVLNYAKANPAVVQVLAQQSAEAVLTIIVRAIGKTQNPVCTYIDTHPDAQQAITQQLFEIIQTLIMTAIDDALV